MKRIDGNIVKELISDINIVNSLKTIEIDVNDCKNAVKLILEKYCDGFTFDDNLSELYTNGVKYFTGQECDWDLKKGLMIIGNVGTGKSLFMKAMQIFTGYITKVNRFNIYTSRQVMNDFLVNGYESFDKYLFNENTSAQKNPYHIAIDDIGRMDENVMNFGTKKNVIQEILADRYEIYKSHGKLTFVTTNLNSEKLEEYYGEWIRSRAREMFNIIKITGKDKRK